MSEFSETLKDHIHHPRNASPKPNPQAVGMANHHGRAPHVVLYLYTKEKLIERACFQATGCGIAIACGSVVTEMIQGKDAAYCRELTVSHLVDALEGIPPDKLFCAAITLNALRHAIEQWTQEATPTTS